MPDPAGQPCCILRPQPPSVKPNPTKNPHQTQQSKSLITGYQPSVCDQQQQKFHRCVGNGPFQQRAWWNGARTLHKRHPKCLRLRAIDRQYDNNRRTLKKHIHVLDCSLPGTQLKMILLSIILLFPKLHVSSWNIVPWPKHEMYIYIYMLYICYIYIQYTFYVYTSMNGDCVSPSSPKNCYVLNKPIHTLHLAGLVTPLGTMRCIFGGLGPFRAQVGKGMWCARPGTPMSSLLNGEVQDGTSFAAPHLVFASSSLSFQNSWISWNKFHIVCSMKRHETSWNVVT